MSRGPRGPTLPANRACCERTTTSARLSPVISAVQNSCSSLVGRAAGNSLPDTERVWHCLLASSGPRLTSKPCHTDPTRVSHFLPLAFPPRITRSHPQTTCAIPDAVSPFDVRSRTVGRGEPSGLPGHAYHDAAMTFWNSTVFRWSRRLNHPTTANRELARCLQRSSRPPLDDGSPCRFVTGSCGSPWWFAQDGRDPDDVTGSGGCGLRDIPCDRFFGEFRLSVRAAAAARRLGAASWCKDRFASDLSGQAVCVSCRARPPVLTPAVISLHRSLEVTKSDAPIYWHPAEVEFSDVAPRTEKETTAHRPFPPCVRRAVGT